MQLLLLVCPWIVVLVLLVVVARAPRELPAAPRARETSRLVSVIVPARNESANIETCLRSLTQSEGVDFEIIVVDDRSDDGTATLARSVPRGRARRLHLIAGSELPDGWLGKPWACAQGAVAAEGDLLLFTDADTAHAPWLLARAVSGVEEEKSDLLTVMGRQIMGSFWERVVLPHIFMLLFLRYPRLEQMARSNRWRDAIANGQYMLFTREAYTAVGGHEGVRDEVAEDLALAQRIKRSGMKLRIRAAQTDLSTRMYRSLGQMIEGWSKNLVMGGLQSVPPVLRPLTLPATVATGIALWIVPPMALVASALGMGGPALVVWSVTATALSVVIWVIFGRIMQVHPGYGPLYPLGAAVAIYIFLRSWLRGRDVEWKGRRYTLRPLSERP